jgi:hypothetical protein
MASIIKAQIAPVSIGHLTIEGLMGDDGNFYIAVPQVSERFQFDTNQASRSIKRLLGINFQFDRAKTSLNPKAVNVMSVPDFERLIAKLDRTGNIRAQEFRDDLVGLSLHQLFCDAFGLKFEQEDRLNWLMLRQESKVLFWELASAVKTWMAGRYCGAPEFTYYKNAFDALNLALFGMQSAKIKEALGLASESALCRDNFGNRALTNIATIQGLAARMMAKDESLKPIDAVKWAVEVTLIEVQDFRS